MQLSLLSALDAAMPPPEPRPFLGHSVRARTPMAEVQSPPTSAQIAYLKKLTRITAVRQLSRYVARKIGKAETWDDAAAMIRSVGGAAFPGRDDAFWMDFARKTCVETKDGIVFDYDPAIAQVAAAPTDQVLPTLWDQFACLKPIPTALIRGALSDLLSPAIVERMQAIKPDLIYAQVPQVGHAPTLEEPEAWAAIAALIQVTSAGAV